MGAIEQPMSVDDWLDRYSLHMKLCDECHEGERCTEARGVVRNLQAAAASAARAR